MTLEHTAGRKRHNPKVTVIEGLVRKELLRAEEVQAVEVLSSVRRVAGIFYGGNVVNMLDDSKRFNTTLEDVSTDLHSFRSISVNAEDVKKGLLFWQGIISSHYDYIELFLQLQRAYKNPLNTEEMREVLQLYVEDQIFRVIPLPLDNSSLLADTIINEIKKRFSFQGFRYAILNSFEKVRPKNTVSIDQKSHYDDENHIEHLVTPEGQQTIDDFLLENFSKLSKQQREVILLYLDGISEQEMKEDYGHTTAEIEQLRVIVSQQFLVKDQQSTIPENIVTADLITVEAAEKEFFTVARQNSLDRIISLLCNIDDYGLYAFLSRFGYMGNRNYQEYAASWGSSKATYKNDYIRALNKIVSLLSKPLEQIDSSISLLELVLNLQSQKVTHVADRPKRLAYSSRRIMFSKTNALGDPTYRSKLTDRQIEVIKLMLKRNGNIFTHSTTDIAAQLGIDESSVNAMFASSYLIFYNPDTQRLIGKDGKPLRSHQQKMLILFKENGLTPFQSANLSPVQKTVFDMSTEPDEMGRYKTIENEVMVVAGLHPETFAKFAKRIVRNLQNVSTIITFQQALNFALLHRERYSDEELIAINKAREMIENGVPLRNETGQGISYKNLAKETGISREHWKGLARGKIGIKAFNKEKRNNSQLFSTERYALLSPYQKHLIAMTRSGLTNIQLANLSSYQRKALDALTTPDENGWYVSMITAMREITQSDKRDSFSKTVQRIIESLQNTSAVEELQQALIYVANNPRQFSENELRAIQIAQKMIKQGMPMMSRKRNLISYKTLSEATGMDYTTCSHFFRRKIINSYQRAVQNK